MNRVEHKKKVFKEFRCKKKAFEEIKLNDKKNVFSCAAAADEKHDALSVGTETKREKFTLRK